MDVMCVCARLFTSHECANAGKTNSLRHKVIITGKTSKTCAERRSVKMRSAVDYLIGREIGIIYETFTIESLKT